MAAKPLIDLILDWLRGHEVATTMLFVYLVAFVLATSIWLFVHGR